MSVRRTDMAGGFFVDEAFTPNGEQRVYTLARWTREDRPVASVFVVVPLTRRLGDARAVRTVIDHGASRRLTDLDTYEALPDKSEYPAYLRDWLATHRDTLRKWERFFDVYHR